MSSVQRGPDFQFPPQRGGPPSLSGSPPCPVWVCVVLFLHTVPQWGPTRSRGHGMRCHGCPDGHGDKGSTARQAGGRIKCHRSSLPHLCPTMPGWCLPEAGPERRGAGGRTSLPLHGLTCGQHHGQHPLCWWGLPPSHPAGGGHTPPYSHTPRPTLGLCPNPALKYVRAWGTCAWVGQAVRDQLLSGGREDTCQVVCPIRGSWISHLGSLPWPPGLLASGAWSRRQV